MTNRTVDDYFAEVKRVLEDRPDRGWVFGVCATLARRSGWDLWVVRLIAALMLMSFTLVAVLAYFVLAMLFHETRPGAQRKLMCWARRADDLLAAVGRGLKNMFDEQRSRRESESAVDQAHRVG